MFLLQLLVGVIDGLDELGEAGGFVHRPKARKAVTQQLDFALGEQSDGYDSFLGQIGAPRLTSISNEALRS
jgi:hypothetical protein